MYFLPIVKKKNLISLVALLCGLSFLHSDIVSSDVTNYLCKTHMDCTSSEDLSCDADDFKARTTSRQNFCTNDLGTSAAGAKGRKTRKTQTNPTLRIIDLGKNSRRLRSSRGSHIHTSQIFIETKALNRLIIIGKLTI